MTGLGYNLVVVLFWLTTMTWLVWTKVLPPLLTGTPPTYATILSEARPKPVGWDILWDGAPAGYAQSEVAFNALDNTYQLLSRVKLQDLPTAKLNPLKISFLNKLLEQNHPRLSMQADSRIEVDSLGRLLAFESSVTGGPLVEPIELLGTAEAGKVRLLVRTGDFSYRTELYLAPERPIGDLLAPQTRLPDLKLGQSWTEPVYNPFLPVTQPMELFEARVDREEFLVWNGRLERTLLVVYHAESGNGQGQTTANIRARTWVRRDGMVLQQETLLGDSVLRFVRQVKPPDSQLSRTGTVLGGGQR